MADALASHATELEELSEIARALAGTLEPDRVLAQVADAAARLVDADGCTLALTEEPGAEAGGARERDGSARVVAASGRSPHALGALLPLRSVQAAPAEPEGARAAACPLQVSGETIGFLVAYRDRTPFTTDELRLLDAFAGHAALALRNARLLDEAQAAARARAQFIATVSHELRTPLNAVLGHLQILEMEIHGPLTPAQADSVGRIGTASRHLRGLIEEVLAFGRLEAGRHEIHQSEVDVAALATEVAAVIEPLAAERAIGFRMETPEHGPVIRTDADRVRQILINLAGNAVKFTERGEVCIRVHEDGEGVVLAVHDTGPGIPSEDQLRLFRPFEQLHAGYARPHGGTGLGLYLSSEYARLLGATIRVRSVPGEGSTFSLVLPRAAAADAPQ
jgi:signal transduction histidine kinase